MKDIKVVVASGKGGTGKTFVSVNLASVFEEEVNLIDCDVEEPDTHLFLNPNWENEENVYVYVPEFNEEKCSLCGMCKDICKFNAILLFPKKPIVFEDLCHGCGACKIICPRDAITEKKKVIGKIRIGRKDNIKTVQGILEIGEARPSPVVLDAIKRADSSKPVIIDSSPGASCPAVSSLKDSDYAILVTEPTPFGLHDLDIVIDVIRELQVPFGVVINRSGIGKMDIKGHLKNRGIEIIAEIPFRMDLAKILAQGKIAVDELLDIRKIFVELKEKVFV